MVSLSLSRSSPTSGWVDAVTETGNTAVPDKPSSPRGFCGSKMVIFDRDRDYDDNHIGRLGGVREKLYDERSTALGLGTEGTAGQVPGYGAAVWRHNWLVNARQGKKHPDWIYWKVTWEVGGKERKRQDGRCR